MHEFLVYTISGLTTAGIYAITAGGLTLTYTTTGVFNFAHGATGMVAAFCFWQMRYAWGWPTPVAFAVCLLVIAPLFGLFLEAAIMRRLEGTSEATRLVVTVSLLLSLVAAALWIWDPSTSRVAYPMLAGEGFWIGTIRIPYNDAIVLVTALAVAIGLRVLLFNTRVGVAMRATVDDSSLARLNGSDPRVAARVAWAVGTSLAALAGIFVAPKVSLSPLPITLLIVNAYAAAMIGRLRSMPMTFVGALLLGLANDYGVGYLPKITTGSQYILGFRSVIPVAVLFVALLLLPSSRLRGHRLLRARETATTPGWAGSLVFACGVVAGAVLLSTVLSAGDLFGITKMWGIAIVALSMVPLVGFAGRLSLCQLSLAGVGAVAAAHLGGQGNPLVFLWAAGAAACVGAVVALPALRLSGIHLALATAAFAVALDRWIFNLPGFKVLGDRFVIFKDGSLNFERPWFGLFDVEGDQAFFIFGAVVFAALSLLVVAVRRGEIGKRLLAMKDSPAACATLGMDVRATTLAAFTLSAAIAGIGGAMFGMGVHNADPGRFDFFAGLPILLMMVVAGLHRPGAALAAGLFLGGPTLANLFPDLPQLTPVMVGLAGVGLGRNPNGFIEANVRPMWAPVLRTPRLLAAGAAVLLAVWAARMGGVIDNWGWALATLALLVVLPLTAGAVVKRREGAQAKTFAEDLDAGLSAPLELLGLAAPFRDSDVAVLDRAVALQGGLRGTA